MAIAAATAAMFLILSGFNGFEGLIKKMFTEFDSDIRIEHTTDKYFTFTDNLKQNLNHPSVFAYSRIIEEKCVFRSQNGNEIGVLKGVDTNYNLVSDVTKNPFQGDFVNFKDSLSNLFMGASLQAKLRLSVQNIHSVVDVWVPKATNQVYLNPAKAFKSHTFYTNGSFHVGQEYDPIYAFCSFTDAQKLSGKQNLITALELKIDSNYSLVQTHQELKKKLSEQGFEVLDRKEQHKELLGFVNLEQKFIILIFILVIILASFNLLGSITILNIEKKENMKTLMYLGASKQFVQKIFWNVSLLMSSLGVLIGLVFGGIIGFIQYKYQLIRMGSSVLSLPYPIEMKLTDVILIICIVYLTTLITAGWSIRKIKNQ